MRRHALALALVLAALVVASAHAGDRVVVFAAASLKTALDVVAAEWRLATGNTVVISYAGSPALAKQIAEGAPAEIFISADNDWMAFLSERNLTKKETEVQLLGNRIVLIAPGDSQAVIDIAPEFNLSGLLGDGRLAMANVDAVPAGRYGKAGLEHLGVWETVKDRVAQAENVRAALALVSTGEAPLGIVYASDAAADPHVRVLGAFPEDSHSPIVYPAAVLEDATSAAAGDFLAFLQSDKARELFEQQGFVALTPPASN